MGSDNEPLHLAKFEVSQIRDSAPTRWSDGVLDLDLHELEASLAGEPGLSAVTLQIVRPGDPVRILNVLDVVEPTVKVPDVDATFPGILGSARMCGTGRLLFCWDGQLKGKRAMVISAKNRHFFKLRPQSFERISRPRFPRNGTGHFVHDAFIIPL